MSEAALSYELVALAADQLLNAGQIPTRERIQAFIGDADTHAIDLHLRTWRAAVRAPADRAMPALCSTEDAFLSEKPPIQPEDLNPAPPSMPARAVMSLSESNGTDTVRHVSSACESTSSAGEETLAAQVSRLQRALVQSEAARLKAERELAWSNAKIDTTAAAAIRQRTHAIKLESALKTQEAKLTQALQILSTASPSSTNGRA